MRRYVYIAIGGALGALARWGLAAALLPHAAFPVGILVVNLSGSLGLGWAFPYTLQTEWDPDLRLGLVTGFFGAYTTFSTWLAGTRALATHDGLLAVTYVAVSLVGGLLCAVAGMALAQRASGQKGDVSGA